MKQVNGFGPVVWRSAGERTDQGLIPLQFFILFQNFSTWTLFSDYALHI